MERKPWSEAELELLRLNFADSRTDDLAQALGRPYTAVAQKASKLGLRKSEAYIASPLAHRLDGLKGNLDKARAVNELGKTLIDSAKVEVDYLRTTGGGESGFIDSAVGASNLPDGITGRTVHRLK